MLLYHEVDRQKTPSPGKQVDEKVKNDPSLPTWHFQASKYTGHEITLLEDYVKTRNNLLPV